MKDPSLFIWNGHLINTKLYNFEYKWNDLTKPVMIAPEESIQLVTDTLKKSVKDHIHNIIEFKDYFKNPLLKNDKILHTSSYLNKDTRFQPIAY